MDPHAVAKDLERSRARLRAAMLRDEEGDADMFPRSATMRFLSNSQGRGVATMLLGGVGSMLLGRRSKRRNRGGEPSRKRGIARSIGSLLGSVLGR